MCDLAGRRGGFGGSPPDNPRAKQPASPADGPLQPTCLPQTVVSGHTPLLALDDGGSSKQTAN